MVGEGWQVLGWVEQSGQWSSSGLGPVCCLCCGGEHAWGTMGLGPSTPACICCTAKQCVISAVCYLFV